MSNPQVPVSSTARRIAKIIINGFRSYFADYQNVTLSAKARFEKADWHGGQQANVARMELYKTKVKQVSELLPTITNKDITDLELWRQAKLAYTQLVFNFPNFEIAETFFNSVFGDVNDHDKIDDDLIYVLSSQLKSIPEAEYSIFIRYENASSPEKLFEQLLDDVEFSLPYENKPRDITNITAEFESEVLQQTTSDFSSLKFDLLESVFYRSKAAYIVGRIIDGDRLFPFIFPVLNNEQGSLFIDTAIFNREEMSVIFSFARTHFMVDAPLPYEYVHFLKELLPHKADYEIYTSLGFPIHAKTELFRDLVNHLRNSSDQFVIAPGIKGMVMSVFTLPSYDIVFKIIKDKFDPPKEVTHEIVMEKYKMVSRHDRIGRMADTLSFINMTLPLDRFSNELLAELKEVAPSQIEIRGNGLLFKLLYTERRMTPLNLYLETADEEQTRSVIEEYGNAIKQLAAANIFPGDMLLKNFGVTRHGRVVFYDYDEICPLTDCNFRKIPEPQTEEQEMASQPWYSVGPNDIFPEEFRLFFAGNPSARKAFEDMHGDIYKVAFWQELQNKIKSGKIVDVFPYRRKRRFRR
ncbi:MAG: bifunctional isocitrate dehydrogenase kinase/phosphatase [Porticoccaceae bacterium]|nr:bifunctional isocitrate dehydrogenase kinase/phosphatase [Pseudomonadales bacterium]MCP5170650.1 bifunctional isocitrate dehydrogenase kinase/phosphatase [Pseudomonadales bacterium]MCP5303563.1 bifunctional isocitrate dehydrogenase kinase/phosphatase [Pseudomonadales bacterium]